MTLAMLVAKGDPDRYAATRAAPEPDRARLWPIYAFNLEIARAPWVTQEPLIAQMRLQFWVDVLDGIEAGHQPRAHEVAGPFAELLRDANLPLAPARAMIAAREHDIARAGFDDIAALLAYLDSTAGNLIWLAGCALGAAAPHESALRAMGRAQGIANWLRAVPALAAAGLAPLPGGDTASIPALAQAGRDALSQARRHALPARLLPVLLTGWLAGPVLTRAGRDPGAVMAGGLEPSPFRRSGSLVLRAFTGRW
jgi:phytoene synthase